MFLSCGVQTFEHIDSPFEGGKVRVLYGLAGEGMGHAMRSRLFIEHLEAQGHQVLVATSGKPSRVLSDAGFPTLVIAGLTLTYRRGGVAQTRSLYRFLRDAPSMASVNLDAYLGPIRDFDPDICISDFDGFAYAVGRWLDRPVLCIDHQHVLDRCVHPRSVQSISTRLAALLVRAKMPGCSHYLVSSFYQPPLRPHLAGTTTLVGPIVRPQVLGLKPYQGDHVLVYQTASGDKGLLRALATMPEQVFRVYGHAKVDAPSNIVFCPFSPTTFLEDLAGAKAVICNGGYTTMSEALVLGKSVLSVPLRKHGEQQLNAAYLEAMGLGMHRKRLKGDVLRTFVDKAVPQIPVVPGNDLATRTLDHHLVA